MKYETERVWVAQVADVVQTTLGAGVDPQEVSEQLRELADWVEAGWNLLDEDSESQNPDEQPER